MTVYYTESENLTLACDNAQTELILKRTNSIKNATMDESSGMTQGIADTDGAVAVDLAGIAEGQFIFIETDAELNVKLNGAAIGFDLKPTVQTPKSSFKVVAGSVTAIVLENVQVGTTAAVKVVVAGAA